MPIAFECTCGRKLKASEEKAGRSFRCPACGAKVTVPEQASIGMPIQQENEPSWNDGPPMDSETSTTPLELSESSSAGSVDDDPTVNDGAVSPQGTASPKKMAAITAAAMGSMLIVGWGVYLAFRGNGSIKPQQPQQAQAGQPAAVDAPIVKPNAAAAKVAAKEAPKLSEIFRTQLLSYLKSAGRLASLTSQGVNIRDFAEQLATVRAELELLEQTWPTELQETALPRFKKSMGVYGLTLKLWNAKLDKKDEPTEPNINGWAAMLAAAGDDLEIQTFGNDYIVEEYRGKRYLPFDPNIGILMNVASREFFAGRGEILALLK